MLIQKQKCLISLMITCAAIGGILYGYDIGVYAGALPFIRDQLGLNVYQVSWIGSAMFAGTLFSTIVTGYLSDRFGRKKMIIFASIVFFIAVIGIVNADNYRFLLAARLLLGIGVGIVQVAVPSYLSEIAPTNLRGLSIALFQLLLTAGIATAYLVGLYFTPTGNWHAMFMVIIVPTAILFLSMLLLPESPRWLIANLQNDKAKNILERIYPPEEARQELKDIIASFKQRQGRLQDLFNRRLAFPLFIGLFVAIFNQLTAINGLLQYAPEVFHSAGFSSRSSDMVAALGLGVINIIGTTFAMLVVDKIGRRRLLVIGTTGAAMAYIFLAICQHQGFSGIYDVIGLLAFVLFFAIGPGVVVWLVMSEFFPTNVRAKGLSLCLFANSLAGWVITSSFLHIIKHFGLGGTYSLFAILTIIYCLVCTKLLPETKQKSLEQVQSELSI